MVYNLCMYNTIKFTNVKMNFFFILRRSTESIKHVKCSEKDIKSYYVIHLISLRFIFIFIYVRVRQPSKYEFHKMNIYFRTNFIFYTSFFFKVCLLPYLRAVVERLSFTQKFIFHKMSKSWNKISVTIKVIYFDLVFSSWLKVVTRSDVEIS